MNILILTPIYYIKGRNNLNHDTSAIHYLVKPWAKEHNVKVLMIYSQPIRKITRYLKNDERRYYREGYFFTEDHVDVAMCEIQKAYKQKDVLSRHQTERVKQFLYKYLEKENFIPEVIVYHIPTTAIDVIDERFADCSKVAVLHESDKRNCRDNIELIEKLSKKFSIIYCRSARIYNYFKSTTLTNLSKELVHSGVPGPQNDIASKRKPELFTILYAGKFIKRKHIDNIVYALSQIQEKYAFIFELYGDGVEKENIRQILSTKLKAGSYAINDSIPRDELMRKMDLADVFVMPSTEETLGLVYLEAMSHGCISIGTMGEGIDGIIINGVNGFLVKPNDVEDLCRKIETVLNMSEAEYSRIATNSIETGKNYNEEDMGKRYLQLITVPISSAH